jgi:hypothetical protein
MPVNAKAVTDRVIARIRSSDYQLTVYYPVVRTPLPGTTPTVLPPSPLSPRPQPKQETGVDPDRVLPEVTVQCLFLEATTMGDHRRTQLAAELSGWHRDITAVARVAGEDVELTDGGTVFDGCDFVELDDRRRFRVLNVVAQRASTSQQGTYYVMLAGSSKWVAQ